MIALKVVLEEPAWPELQERLEDVINIQGGGQITLLQGGMESGRDSVCLRVDLPDGKVLLFETSLRLFLSAAEIMKAKSNDACRLPASTEPGALAFGKCWKCNGSPCVCHLH